MSSGRDGIFPGGIGSCIFGEEGTARVVRRDDVNEYLRNKYLFDYFKFAHQNNTLGKEFENDLNKLRRSGYYTYLYALTGVVFAGVIYNPNYTSRHSFYLRKMTPIFFGLIGYAFGHAQHSKLINATMLRMNDHLPLEVKRTL